MSEYTKSLKKDMRNKHDELMSILRNKTIEELTPNQRTRVIDLNEEIRSLETNYARAKSEREQAPGRSAEDERAFSRYLRYGDSTGLKIAAPSAEERAMYRAAGIERRWSDGTGISGAPNDAGVAPGSGGTGYGGYMVPQGFWHNLQIAQKAYGGLANSFKQVTTDTGAPMPWPATDYTGVTASLLTGENQQLNISNSYTFGQGMLQAWPLAIGPVLASLQLVNDSAFDVDNFISTAFGEAVGREVASLVVSGTGSAEPEGIITALAARGSTATTVSGGYYALGTATDVAIFGNYSSPSTTELTGNVLAPNSLIGMIKGVDPAYYPGSKWYFNATQAWNLRTITDANGRPLLNFANGFQSDNMQDENYSSNSPVGQLFGFDVVIDNNVPNLVASTVGGPIFGNLSKAMVLRQVNGVSVLRLQERFADYLAIGYIGWYRFDARSNDLRAAVTVMPASS